MGVANSIDLCTRRTFNISKRHIEAHCDVERCRAMSSDVERCLAISGDIRRYPAISGDIRRYWRCALSRAPPCDFNPETMYDDSINVARVRVGSSPTNILYLNNTTNEVTYGVKTIGNLDNDVAELAKSIDEALAKVNATSTIVTAISTNQANIVINADGTAANQSDLTSAYIAAGVVVASGATALSTRITTIQNADSGVTTRSTRVTTIENTDRITNIALVDNKIVVATSGIDDAGDPTTTTETITPYSSTASTNLTNGIALGASARAFGGGICIGNLAVCGETKSIVIGTSALISRPGELVPDLASIVVGPDCRATGNSSILIGRSSANDFDNSIAIGADMAAYRNDAVFVPETRRSPTIQCLYVQRSN